MNRTLRNTLALGTFALLGLSRPAHAQNVYFPVNTTINSDVPNPPNPNRYAIVGYANDTDFAAMLNPTSPTVNLVSGVIWGNIQVYDQSVLNMSGGRVNVRLRSYNNSTVNVTGGDTGPSLEANGSSIVNLRGGGQEGNHFFASDYSVINVTGGSPGHIYMGGGSTLNISGGSVGEAIAQGRIVNVTGGTIRNVLWGYGGAINISGGYVNQVIAYGSVSITGGHFVELQATNSEPYNSNDGGIIDLYGSNLTKTLIDPNWDGYYSRYALSGKLADGTDLSGVFFDSRHGTAGQVVFHEVVGPFASGTLSFTGITPSAGPQNVTFTFRPTDGSAPVTQTVSVPANGAFSLGGLPSKAGVLHIKADNFLAANVNVDLTNGSVLNLTANLLPGDYNNDNRCDILDFGGLVNAYGTDSSVPNSGYDANADFNKDGRVDVEDFGALVNNYGTVGDL